MSEAPEAPTNAPESDPAQLRYASELLHSEQNLMLALIGGSVASLVGAGLWAAITAFSGFQLGIVAIAIGFLVGISVRTLGKGIDRVFGLVGGGLSLAGCAAGNLLAICILISGQNGVPLLDVITGLELGIIVELMTQSFSPMDLIFYGIAVYEGYGLSFRRVSEDDLRRLLAGSGAPLPPEARG